MDRPEVQGNRLNTRSLRELAYWMNQEHSLEGIWCMTQDHTWESLAIELDKRFTRDKNPMNLRDIEIDEVEL